MDKNLLKEVPDTRAEAIKRRLAKQKSKDKDKDKK
jgi:hypothetical protein